MIDKDCVRCGKRCLETEDEASCEAKLQERRLEETALDEKRRCEELKELGSFGGTQVDG